MARLAVAFCLGFLLASPSFAATWHIDPNGTGDAPTIQAGIDSAVVGDTVELADGTFTGDGNRDVDPHGKNVVVRSVNGNGSTTIDCEGSDANPHRAFHLHSGENPSSAIEGIRIRGGRTVRHSGTWTDGGAIYCDSASAPTIRSCVFTQNFSATCGGAVGCGHGSNPEIAECIFESNAAGGAGGALDAWWLSSPTIRECVFEANHAGMGGGALYLEESSSLVLDCEFLGNTVDDTSTTSSREGGAVAAYYSDAAFVRCTFASNQAANGGALYGHFDWSLLQNDPLTLTGCLFAGNEAASGGAMSFLFDYNEEYSPPSEGIAVLDSCDVYGNTAADGSAIQADGIVYGGRCPLVVRRSILAGGSGSAYHQSIAGNFLPPTFSCTDIFGNTGGDWDGGIAGLEGVDGNFSADPLFCDAAGGDFTLDAASPCLPWNHPDGYACGLIGAFGQGCDVFTAVAEGGSMPGRAFGLFASPNPSTGEVSLRYARPSAAATPIVVYDIRGRVVRSLVADGASGAITWNGRSASGAAVAPGVYFVRIEDGRRSETRRITIIR